MNNGKDYAGIEGLEELEEKSTLTKLVRDESDILFFAARSYLKNVALNEIGPKNDTGDPGPEINRVRELSLYDRIWVEIPIINIYLAVRGVISN